MEKLLRDLYRDEVEQFFRGTLPTHQCSMERGTVRIVTHGTIETLQVQPPDLPEFDEWLGQYEIAVRVPFPDGYLEKDKHQPECKYMGYIASDGYIWGVNTGGH